MKISCPNCSAAYELDDSRVPPAGLSIKCPKCKNPFTVQRPRAGDASKQGVAVPLPGLAGSGAPAAQPPSGRPPGAKRPPPMAVPLPGMGAAAPASSGPAGAVPLPGLDAAPAHPRVAAAFPVAPPSAPLRDEAVPLPGADGDDTVQVGDDPFAAIDLGAEAARQPPPAGSVDDLDLPDSLASPGGVSPAADDGFHVDLPEPSAPAHLPSEESRFDRVEPPRQKAATQGASDMLDFVDDGPKPEKKTGRPPPPMVGKPPEPSKEEVLSLDEPDQGEAAADAKKAEKERKKRERAERARRKAAGPSLIQRLRPALASAAQPKRLAAAAVLLAIAGAVTLGIRARHTSAGLFWMNLYLPSKKAASAAESKVIQDGMARLAKGDFDGTRGAVAAGAQLLTVLPEDEDAKAFFVLAASELKLQYGQAGSDWDQARRVMEKMKVTAPAQNRARGAYALANGDAAGGKQLLATLGDPATLDLESAWLYARALILTGEQVRGAQVLDVALKKNPGSAKLLLLRAGVARDRGQLAESAAFYEKALQAAPESAAAMVELADVRLRLGDAKAARELLARALDAERRKTLDAAEEARGNVMMGRLLATEHDTAGAEAAFERAVALDPNSGKVHEAYGDFRLQRREWEKAGRQFEAAIQHGASAAANAGAARAYLGQNRLLEADKAITEAVNKEPGNARYLYLQGRVADAIGKAEEAYRKYEAALKAKPDLVEALAAEGGVWMSRNDKAKAQEKLDAALAVKGEGLTTLEDEAIGDLALAMGNPAKAQEAFARALAKDPGDALAHAGIGKALAAQENLAGARKEMEVALKGLDSDASLAYEYGSLLRRMKEPEAALQSLRNAVKLDSKEPRYRARLGALLVERGAFEEAEQELRQAVLMNDRNAEGQYFLARALAGRKKMGEAIDTVKKAVELEPDNAEYLFQMGVIYERSQQVQDAINAFNKSIDRDGKNADGHEHLGLNLMVENRYPEAATALGKAAALEPKRARLWAELGDAEQQGGDVDGAIRDFQKALSLDSNLPSVWTKLGIAYKDKDCKGCRTKAVDALKRATHVDPADAVAHHELGYMFKDDGRRKDAIVEFRRYLDLKPDAGDAASVRDDIYYLQEESRRAP
ncbi:MAG TPA: tetratricopeptide repeat protein [Myxococcales bacterium]|nr:tetratricopeptide repeat protein [Myxococcales bacterium]